MLFSAVGCGVEFVRISAYMVCIPSLFVLKVKVSLSSIWVYAGMKIVFVSE